MASVESQISTSTRDTLASLVKRLPSLWRTAREDKTLQAELPGYAEYTTETRFRLLPGIW